MNKVFGTLLVGLLVVVSDANILLAETREQMLKRFAIERDKIDADLDNRMACFSDIESASCDKSMLSKEWIDGVTARQNKDKEAEKLRKSLEAYSESQGIETEGSKDPSYSCPKAKIVFPFSFDGRHKQPFVLTDNSLWQVKTAGLSGFSSILKRCNKTFYDGYKKFEGEKLFGWTLRQKVNLESFAGLLKKGVKLRSNRGNIFEVVDRLSENVNLNRPFTYIFGPNYNFYLLIIEDVDVPIKVRLLK